LREKGGASDLVQQTFLEAQTAFPRFQGGTQDELLAWMRKLLRNNLIDFTRRFRDVAKRSSEREVAIDAQETPSQSASMVAAETPSPSGHAIAHERDQALHEAIDRLPDDYRSVLRARYEQGQSFEAIAEQMGRSREAVRKLWAR